MRRLLSSEVKIMSVASSPVRLRAGEKPAKVIVCPERKEGESDSEVKISDMRSLATR